MQTYTKHQHKALVLLDTKQKLIEGLMRPDLLSVIEMINTQSWPLGNEMQNKKFSKVRV